MTSKCTLEHVAKFICKSLNNNYIDFIDAGSFKETFLIEDDNGIMFALKVFKENNSNERTEREIDAMKRAKCKFIAHLVKVDTIMFKDNKYLYMLEEYLEGGSLSSYIDSGTLKRSDIIKLGYDMIQALAVLKSVNIVHRDIKPDNILFRNSGGTAVLVDLGLVRDLNARSLTKTFHMRGPGTPLYSSPEQLNNEKALINWRTDQFALGITLCVALLRMHPFEDGIKTIDKMASYSKCNEQVKDKLAAYGMQPIITMIEPHPVNRYRLPTQLVEAWGKMKV